MAPGGRAPGPPGQVQPRPPGSGDSGHRARPHPGESSCPLRPLLGVPAAPTALPRDRRRHQPSHCLLQPDCCRVLPVVGLFTCFVYCSSSTVISTFPPPLSPPHPVSRNPQGGPRTSVWLQLAFHRGGRRRSALPSQPQAPLSNCVLAPTLAAISNLTWSGAVLLSVFPISISGTGIPAITQARN